MIGESLLLLKGHSRCHMTCNLYTLSNMAPFFPTPDFILRHNYMLYYHVAQFQQMNLGMLLIATNDMAGMTSL